MTEEELSKILRTGYVKIAEDSAAGKITDMELPVGSEQVEAQECPRFTAPVRITVHSIRKRLTDADGASFKAVLDGIVKAGVLQDDSPKYVKEVSYTQEKGKEEQTIITIEEV